MTYQVRYPDGKWVGASADCAQLILEIMSNPTDPDYRDPTPGEVPAVENVAETLTGQWIKKRESLGRHGGNVRGRSSDRGI